MLVNLIILIVLIALTAGLAYLTYRAVRARRMWVKVAGGLFGGVATLLVAAIAGLGLIGMLNWYPAINPPVPVADDWKVEATPAQLARGQYIVSFSCAGCHSQSGDYQPPLAGGDDFAKEIPMPIGSLIVSNISSDGQIKDYTDAQLFRAVRHGVRRDGSKLVIMSNLIIREFADEDIKAVIAYLRAQPPANNARQGGDSLNYLALMLFGAGMFPPYVPGQQTIALPEQGATPAYGKYVATLGDCRGCHGPDMTGTPNGPTGPGAPNPRPFVATLTLDQFKQMLHTGARPDGTLLKMPWQNASKMTDDDLAAIYAYLKAEVK
jgi:cytochrome c553